MAWSVKKSDGVYGLSQWGSGYFSINAAGEVQVKPSHDRAVSTSLYDLVEQAAKQSLDLPLLVRFPCILQSRVKLLYEAFATTIADFNYQNDYTAIYPIKVNQQEAVIKSIVATENVNIGVEAGSKPELMAVLALSPMGGKIVCNGYKDREFVDLALMGQKLGHEVFIVIEKESEIDLVIEAAVRLNVRPTLGVRVRLSSLASSKWADTGGEKGKFGLSAAQLMRVIDKLAAVQMQDCVRLLHFHMGSQISNIADYRIGFKEALRYFGELRLLGCPLDFIDVGGGLGVDYDGTGSRTSSSINYDLDEYADTIVGMLVDFCAEMDIPHPHIFSESGRAMTAHHAVLIMNVTDVERLSEDCAPLSDFSDDILSIAKLVQIMALSDAQLTVESYHRATHLISDIAELYGNGNVSLKEKAMCEQLYFTLCRRLHGLFKKQTTQRAQREVYDELTDKLADKYFCNFSVFQSLPDTWAIGQVLPIMPIHRLNEEPTRRAVLQDLTCDSDGKIRAYVDNQSIESSLPVHEVTHGEQYLIGAFMVGAYQEILGDMHNLFGDTDSINAFIDEAGDLQLTGEEEHDTIEDMLRYVHLQPAELIDLYEGKIRAAKLSTAESRYCLMTYKKGLKESSYLVV